MGTPYAGGQPQQPTDLVRVVDVPRFARGASFVPRVGQSIAGTLMLGSTSGSPTYQRVYFTPFAVGPAGWTTDAALMSVSTAYSGGANLSENVGIYADDGSGFPSLAGGPIAQASTTAIGSTGGKTLAFGTPVDLTPGLYWIATLLTGTSAQTGGAVQCITNSAYQLALPSGIAVGTTARAYTLNGQSALPTTQPADSSFSISGGNDAPVVNLRRSA